MNKIRTVIVDDNFRFIKSAIGFINLSQEMEVVGGAFSGEMGMEMINKMKPDLVLLDLSLPDINGIELIGKIKGSCVSSRVIVVTIQDDKLYKDISLESGADGFISKSDFGDKIIPMIHHLYN
jgi:DNA-binding NarL/FixJ family response regulator